MACWFLPRLLVLFLVLELGLLAEIRAADPSDKFVSEEEFSALFEPDPLAVLKQRGMASMPRLNAKRREATTYLLYEHGSILLKDPESFLQLDAAGKAFKKALEVGKANKWIIEIVGHTDNTEALKDNERLSLGRALNVRQYLIDTYELPPNTIIARGKGAAQPITSNDTLSGRARNRRVVFHIGNRTSFDTGLGAFQSGNYDSALDQWEVLAEHGILEAQFYLGVLYANGKGTPQDYKSGLVWFTAAAERGHAIAQYNLSQMYFEGLGAIQDFVLAHKWANISSANGVDKAIEMRDAISSKMTPTQIAEAQKLAREWKPKK